MHEKGLIPAPLPSWAQGLLSRLHEATAPMKLYGDGPPNHILLNSYRPGEGIMVSHQSHQPVGAGSSEQAADLTR